MGTGQLRWRADRLQKKVASIAISSMCSERGGWRHSGFSREIHNTLEFLASHVGSMYNAILLRG
jgi:hypothetical protein